MQQKARAFAPEKNFSLEYFLRVCLELDTVNVRQASKNLVGVNTQAYFVPSSVAKQKVL
jgi:hypothetical protein